VKARFGDAVYKNRKKENNPNKIDKKLEERYQQHKQNTQQQNIRRQNQLKTQYIKTNFERFYLIDFIKTEERSLMINNLKQLFRYNEISDGEKIHLHFHRIPDFSKTGILLTTGCHFRGCLYNENYYQNTFFLNGPKGSLPEFLDRMEIFIHNFDKKMFCIIYKCVIHNNFKSNDFEDAFIHSEDFKTILDGDIISSVPKIDYDQVHPILNDKIIKTIEFISKQVNGLFINDRSFYKKEKSTPPNVKILSIRSINFTRFKKWELKNRDFLRFLDMQYPFYSRYNKFVISDQRTKSFGKGSTNAGFVILYSLRQIEIKPPFTCKEGYLDAELDDLIDRILPYFYVYHKTNFIAESTISFFDYCKDKLKLLILKKKFFIKKYFNKTMNLCYDFQKLYFDEKNHLTLLSNIVKESRYDIDFTPLLRDDCNVSDGLKNGAKELIKIETRELEERKKEFESLKDFSIGEANFSLQNRISLFTIIVVIFTILLAIIEIFFN